MQTTLDARRQNELKERGLPNNSVKHVNGNYLAGTVGAATFPNSGRDTSKFRSYISSL
jgi:hypothetical protein